MTLQQKVLVSTPLEQLRQVLGQLESLIGKLDHDSREEALQIPWLFDSAYAALNRLRQEGVLLPAEEARFQTVSAQFERKDSLFLRKIGGARVLEEMRQQEQPGSAQWWWSIDRVLAARQKLQLRQQGRVLLVAGAVIAGLVLLYVLFLAPDKETRARLQLQQDAERLAQEGAYTEALGEIRQALVYAPDDVELLVWQGVLEKLLGQDDAAEATFATAESIAGSRKQFLLERAQVYLTLYQTQALLDDAEAVVRLDPEAPEGYLYLAQAYAQMGDYLSAQDYFDKTATLAAAAGDSQLEAIARVQLAQLYQMMLSQPEATSTPLP